MKTKKPRYEYGYMVSTEIGMGLGNVIPFRIRSVPAPDKKDPNKCSVCKLDIYKCEC